MQLIIRAENNAVNRTIRLQSVRRHLDSPVALYIIKNELFPMFTPKVIERQLLRAVPDQLHSHPAYVELVNQVRAADMKVGSLAPDIQGKTPNGETVKLSDLQGKYVLLDFWASWCGPCRREFPYLKQALELPEAAGRFCVLSYSIDNKEKAWTDCIEANQLKHPSWIHISTLKGWSSDAVELFGVEAVPKTVLLNPEGQIVAFDLRGEEMVEKIRQLTTNFQNQTKE